MNRTSTTTLGWLAAGTLTLFACVAIVAAQTAKPEAQAGAKPAPAKPAAMKPAPAKGSNSPSSLAFRSSVDTPPAGWKGPVFKLSRDYPKTTPKCDAPWLKRQVNFNSPNPQWKEWEAYVQDIIDYVKAGQDPNLANGWNIAVGGQTQVVSRAVDGVRRTARTRVRARVDQRAVHRAVDVSPGRGTSERQTRSPWRRAGERRQSALRDVVDRHVQPVRRARDRSGVSAERRARDLHAGRQDARARACRSPKAPW